MRIEKESGARLRVIVLWQHRTVVTGRVSLRWYRTSQELIDPRRVERWQWTNWKNRQLFSRYRDDATPLSSLYAAVAGFPGRVDDVATQRSTDRVPGSTARVVAQGQCSLAYFRQTALHILRFVVCQFFLRSRQIVDVDSLVFVHVASFTCLQFVRALLRLIRQLSQDVSAYAFLPRESKLLVCFTLRLCDPEAGEASFWIDPHQLFNPFQAN